MSEAEATTPDAPPETIDVDNLDTFVQLLLGWHARKVKVLEHILALEGGIEMQVGDEPSFMLEGDILKGMKAGINLALMEFGNLPFAYEMEAPEAEPEATGG